MTPEDFLASLAPALIVLMLLTAIGVALARWWTRFQWPAEPWEAELDQAMEQPEAVPVCPACLEEQPPLPGWFCPHCGAPVGQCNNLMPRFGSCLWAKG